MPVVWECLIKIAFAGAFGGIIYTILSGEGFALPQWKSNVLCLGFIGNVVIGATAAAVSWGLYGAGSGMNMLASSTTEEIASLSVSTLSGALLIGAGGATWLKSEIDKRLAINNMSEAGALKLSPEDCRKLRSMSPKSAAARLEKIKAASEGSAR